MKYLKLFESFISKKSNDKILNTFIRFGGLDLKNQNGYSKDPDSFHQPPATRGFYAMPKTAQDFFLIGSLGSTNPGLMPKIPDVFSDEEYTNHYKKVNKIYSQIRKEFTVDNDVNIWHHLGDSVKNNEIIDRNGSWVKTDLTTWKKAFSKDRLQLRLLSGGGDINAAKKTSGIYSKDHYEVFFDEKIA